MYALMPVGNGRPSLLLIIQATALISSASLGLLPSGDASPLNPISYSRYGAAALRAGPARASPARAVAIQVRRAKAMAADIVRLRGVSRPTCSSGNLRAWFRLLKVRKENPSHVAANHSAHGRSEERRVGKECRRLCRSRWSP